MDGHANNHAKPLGLCHRLFNLVVNSLAFHGLKRITLGNTQAKTEQENQSGNKVAVEINSREAATLIIPVEGALASQDATTVPDPQQQVVVPDEVKGRGESTAPKDAAAVKSSGDSARTRASRKKEELKKKPSISRKGDTQDKLKEKAVLVNQEQEENNKILRPAKPKLKEALDIDEKSGAFIQSKREALRAGSSPRPVSDS